MSADLKKSDLTRISNALARTLGVRWCGNCRADRKVAGGKWITPSRWICASCADVRAARLRELGKGGA